MGPQYRELARKRTEFVWEGFGHPEDYGYDFREYVSPYTKGAANFRSETMIVLQDWASHDGLVARGMNTDIQRLGRDPSIRTNRRLEKLLRDHLGVSFAEIYATNAFVFIKKGGMSAGLSIKDVRRCIQEFTRYEVEIVRPKRILALGKLVAQALRDCGIDCFELPHPAARISDAKMGRCWAGIDVLNP